MTIVAALHDVNLAALFFPRLALLRDGKIYRDGQPKDVLTEETIHEVYGIHVQVRYEAAEDRPQILLSPAP